MLLTVRLYAKGLVRRTEGQGSSSKAPKLYRVEPGDFVVSKIDARNGAWGFVPEELGGGLVSGDFPILALNRCVADEHFVELALGQRSTWEPLRDIAFGTTNRRRLQVLELLETTIALPPIAEQQAIARVLRVVRQAKEATEAVIAATRELKKSLMRHLFTYGPVPVQEAARVPLKETEFGSVPEHWVIVSLEQLALVQTGVAKGRRLDASSTITLPYLRVANVQDGYLDLGEMKTIAIEAHELSRYRLQPDDVVLTEGGDFDKLGRGFVWRGQIETCVHQNHVFAVRLNRQRLLPAYVAYLAQSAYGKNYFLTVAHRTTHLACINSAKLKAFPVPVPPLEDQESIVEILQATDRKLSVEENRKQALEALFNSLLHNLMTGKVRVGDMEHEGPLDHENTKWRERRESGDFGDPGLTEQTSV